jgi:hypothetical protein
MTGVQSFIDIPRGMPLISRAVLVARLRELKDRGVIERWPRADGAGHGYWLTPAGEGLRVVMHARGGSGSGVILRVADVARFSLQNSARRVTTVAAISSAGILRQQAQGRVSGANSSRERSMQVEKRSSGRRSTFALARWRNKASRESSHLATEIGVLPASSEEDASRRPTVAAGSR